MRGAACRREVTLIETTAGETRSAAVTSAVSGDERRWRFGLSNSGGCLGARAVTP